MLPYLTNVERVTVRQSTNHAAFAGLLNAVFAIMLMLTGVEEYHDNE
jgi:hypothetical protein